MHESLSKKVAKGRVFNMYAPLSLFKAVVECTV